MKPSEAGILFVGHCALFAGVCAEALPPDSIPIKCATICGPMVELSSICSGKSSSPKSNSKRAQKNKEFHQINNEHVIQRRKHTTERAKQPGGLDERDFTVIVPAPTSFPSSLIVDESAHPPQQSKITRIRPSEILPTQQPPPPPSKSTATQPPPPPPAPTKPQSTNNGGGASTNPGTNRGGTTATSWRNPQSTMDAMNDGDGDGADDGDTPQQTSSTKTGTATSTAVPDKDQGRWTMNSGEKDCVCENKSFNVQQVAALCSSCIAIANRRKNDMDVIMTGCKFASESYTPDKDKVVNNVRVQAKPATPVLGQNTGVENSAACTPSPIRTAFMAATGALSLLQWLLR